MENPYATARQMLVDLHAKRISARELLDAHVARNSGLQTKLNAVVVSDIDAARTAAQAIDDARAMGEALGALAGLPMTIKDGFDVAGMPASAGAPFLAHRDKNCADAALVARARDAGALIWGKTNVPFMLGDFQTYNAVYGTTNNPYDMTRTPGGSSGGAAAALAAGITPLEIGSDIGGSLRHPANFCGVCALKPSWGALPMRGHVPPPPGINGEGTDLGVGGPMARNVDDLKLLWRVLSARQETPRQSVRGARIAMWDEDGIFPSGRDARRAVASAGEALAAAGAEVDVIASPVDTDLLMDCYMRILFSIISVGFPEAIMHQMRATRDSDLNAVANGVGPWSAEFYRLAATSSAEDVRKASHDRDGLKNQITGLFAKYDAIVMPIAPVAAFPHDQNDPFNARRLQMDGTAIPYASMLGWIALATALHLPALAVPAGRAATNMPVGVQIVGPANSEARLFDFAAVVEDALGGFSPPALSP